MRIDQMYFAVFFIEGLPQDFRNSEYKRISFKEFSNLTDGIESKEVFLKPKNHAIGDTFLITDVKSFGIENSIDNHLFAVVTVKKIK